MPTVPEVIFVIFLYFYNIRAIIVMLCLRNIPAFDTRFLLLIFLF